MGGMQLNFILQNGKFIMLRRAPGHNSDECQRLIDTWAKAALEKGPVSFPLFVSISFRFPVSTQLQKIQSSRLLGLIPCDDDDPGL